MYSLKTPLLMALFVTMTSACGQISQASLNQTQTSSKQSTQVQLSQAQSNQPLTFNKVTFPQGKISFADRVVSLEYNGAGAQVKGENRDANRALGQPDEDYVSLGNSADQATSSDLILEFTDNRLVDISGPDLYIFETGPSVEATSVEISVNGSRWFPLGRIEGSTRSIDLSDYSQLPAQAQYRFVRLRDFPDGNTSGSPYAGPDIDAVGAIGSVSASPEPLTPSQNPENSSNPSNSNNAPQGSSCSVEDSIFKAIGNNQYSLVFDNASAFATVPYTVTLSHRKRGTVDRFDYSVSVGYPSVTLNLQRDRGKPEPRGFSIYFFDERRRPAYDAENASFAVIHGLGAYDYYSNVDSGAREHELGDVMWRKTCR